MGRGGPAEPEVIETPPTVDEPRRALARRPARRLRPPRDRRALRRADDRLPARGRRARRRGVRLERRRRARASPRERAPDVVVFDGSGAAIPPIAVDRRVLVVGAGHDLDSYFNTYRRLDLRPRRRGRLRRSPARSGAELRLRPLEPLEGRVAVFTAGPARRRPPRRRRRPRLAATSPTATRCARELAAARRRHVPRRAEGGRDRRRRRARARARAPRRARRERRRRAEGLDEALLALAAGEAGRA